MRGTVRSAYRRRLPGTIEAFRQLVYIIPRNQAAPEQTAPEFAEIGLPPYPNTSTAFRILRTQTSLAKDRKTGKVQAQVVDSVDMLHLTAFVSKTAKPGSTVYTDENPSYGPVAGRYRHESVNHGAGGYVDGPVHVNGIESFWAMLKRAHKGTFHKISKKHLHRYVNEFAGRHNIRSLDTLEQMAAIVSGMDQKQLMYKDLIA